MIILSDAGMRGEERDERLKEGRGGAGWDKNQVVDKRTVIPKTLLGGVYVTEIGYALSFLVAHPCLNDLQVQPNLTNIAPQSPSITLEQTFLPFGWCSTISFERGPRCHHRISQRGHKECYHGSSVRLRRGTSCITEKRENSRKQDCFGGGDKERAEFGAFSFVGEGLI